MPGRIVVNVFQRLPHGLKLWLVRRGTPKYTLGVLVVVRRPDGRILLVRQAYRPGWFLPGGLLRRGESRASAARRELVEEIGVDTDDIELSALATPALRHRWVTWHGLVDVDDSAAEAIRPHGAELLSVRWASIDELPDDAQEAHIALARRPVEGHHEMLQP